MEGPVLAAWVALAEEQALAQAAVQAQVQALDRSQEDQLVWAHAQAQVAQEVRQAESVRAARVPPLAIQAFVLQ